MLLDDFLVGENSAFQSDINSPMVTSDRPSTITSPKFNQSNASPFATTPNPDSRLEVPSSGATRFYSVSYFVQIFLPIFSPVTI